MGFQNNTAWAQEALGIIGGKKPPKTKAPKAPKAPKAKRRRNLAIPKTLTYPKITAKNPIKVSQEEKIGGGLAAYGARAKISAAGKKALQALGGARAGAAAVAPAAIAGLAAYWLTTAILKKKARTLEEQRENSFQAAQAYRRLREDIKARQGRALTAAQQKQAAAAFQKALLDLGLSSHDLSKNNQTWMEKGF